MYTYKDIDENEYELERNPEIKSSKNLCKYVRKNPINATQKNNRNEFVYKNNFFGEDIFFGEVIGSIIAKATIENGCDAELVRKPRHFNGIMDNGVASYYYFAEGDKSITSFHVMHQYYQNENRQMRALPRMNDVIKALRLFLYQNHRPEVEQQRIKQQYIDMVLLDCRLGNHDRVLENWMVYEDGQTHEIQIYPMFDNESVLGFDRPTVGATPERIIEYCENLRMSHIAPSAETRECSRMEDIIKYLWINYPEETQIALRKINRFSLEDLSQLLDEFPDLSEERKVVVKQMFITRGLLLERYIKEAEKEQAQLQTVKIKESD